jgi:DNA-binding XRE family transcriptional regulator
MEKKDPKLIKHMGAMIKLFRKRSAIDQEDMALTLGLSRVSMINIESGRQSISHSALMKAFMVLGFKTNDIYPDQYEPLKPLIAPKTERKKTRIDRLEKKLELL